MTRGRAVLRVIRVHECPLYHPDDRIEIRPPALLGTKAGFCLYLASQATTVLLPRLLAPAGEPGELTLCCMSGSERCAEFLVQILPLAAPERGISDEIEVPDDLLAEDERPLRPAERVLAEQAVFAGLPRHKIAKIAAAMEIRELDAGVLLVEEGVPAPGLHIIARGAVELFRTAEDGSETPLGRRGRHYSCGERSLLGDHPALISVLTVMPVTLAFLRREVFWNLVGDDPLLLDHLTTLGFDEQLLERGVLLDPADD